jgi:hypothetical protein
MDWQVLSSGAGSLYGRSNSEPMASAGNGQGAQARIRRAVGTSVHGNAPAFGFSIMITASFGVVSTLRVPPTLTAIFLFGIAAALAVGLFEGVITRGFRERLDEAPQEVQLLGTAFNVFSVAAGVGVAMGTAWLVVGLIAWPLAGFLAAMAYVATESVEILLAGRLQAKRGDEEAEPAG